MTKTARRLSWIGAAVGVALASLAGAWAQDARMVPTSREEVQLSFAPVVQQAAPAVVNIYSERTVQTRLRTPFHDDPFFRRFFGDDLNDFFGMPRERVQRSLGSGVLVRPDGVIVTNNHVVEDFEDITVVLADRRELQAKVLLTDPKTDLAVLKIAEEGETFPFLAFANSDTAEVGDIVLAIGNPFGVGQTVTTGIVSALARTQVGVTDYQFFIQTDAAINPGNSGGALVSLDGRLLGVNTAIFSRSGGSNGIGFAIPANMVDRVVAGAVDGGVVMRPWLGAQTEAVTAELAESFGLKRPVGAFVIDTYRTGPAAKAGLKRGDVILSVDGFEVFDENALRYRIATKSKGDKVTLVVSRGGRERSYEVTLALPPETPAKDERQLSGRHPLDGATAANLSPAFAEEMGRPVLETGVILTKVTRGSIAARYGFRPGDKILVVNDREIDSVRTLGRALSGTQPGWSIDLERNGRKLSLDTQS